MVKFEGTAMLVCMLLVAVTCVAGRAQVVDVDSVANYTSTQDIADGSSSTNNTESSLSAADLLTDEDTDVALEDDLPVQYPFRDLPADVLRDFPGLCFGSTALRLFQVGQSWSLTPFRGVATCLVSRDGYHLMERVQDCGPQPLRNPKCKNVNLATDGPFPSCCPVFECEEGVELEYPTQEELQKLAHEAAQAAVRAQYEEDIDEDEAPQSARVAALLEIEEDIPENENATPSVASASGDSATEDVDVAAASIDEILTDDKNATDDIIA